MCWGYRRRREELGFGRGLVRNSGGKCGFDGSASGEVLLRCERDKGANLFGTFGSTDLTRRLNVLSSKSI